jgi:hypothetical protein
MRIFYCPTFESVKSWGAFTIGSVAAILPASIMSVSSTSLGIFAGSDMKSFVDIIKKINVFDSKIVDIAALILIPVNIGLIARIYGSTQLLYSFSNYTCNLSERYYIKTAAYLGPKQKKTLKTLLISSTAMAYFYTLYNLKDYSISTDNPNFSDRLAQAVGSITGLLSILNLSRKFYSKN